MKLVVLAPVVLALAACSPAPVPAKEAAISPVTAVVAPPPPAPLPLVGVLEDRPASTTGKPARFVVRMLFQKEGAGWKSLAPECSDQACLTSAPAKLPPADAWTVVYGGANKGLVKVKTPSAWSLYSDVGTQELANGSLIRTVGERTRLFSADGATLLYRPLVAISAPAASDPDAWKAEKLPPETVTAIQAAFRTQFAEVVNCDRKHPTNPKPVTYADKDILLSNVSASTKSWAIATARLKDYRCDGPFDDTAFAPQTYAISPEGKVQHLGESLHLVDAGDFDGDGKSELMFAIGTYNTGGYELRFNDFAGRATFAFSYH